MAQAIAVVGGLHTLPLVAAAPANGALPAPEQSGGMPLARALSRRRSVRRFAAQPLALAAAAQLLWAAQGMAGPNGRRTVPSAGALYPIELHLLAARVDGLASGLYRYLPARHALQGPNDEMVPQGLQPALQQAAGGQATVGAAAAVVIISAVEARSAVKYGGRAARYAAFEAGAAAQNLALQAAALELGALVVGGFDDAAVVRLLRLPPGELPVVLMPIGHPA
jgi:SagB-type dehydrogenase family enzyme